MSGVRTERKIKDWIHMLPIGSERFTKIWILGDLTKIHDVDNRPRVNAKRWIHPCPTCNDSPIFRPRGHFGVGGCQRDRPTESFATSTGAQRPRSHPPTSAAFGHLTLPPRRSARVREAFAEAPMMSLRCLLEARHMVAAIQGRRGKKSKAQRSAAAVRGPRKEGRDEAPRLHSE
jgi:hypothetical protein